MAKKIALVAGATGLTGNAFIEQLKGNDEWEIIALSRRADERSDDNIHYVAADLQDIDSLTAKLSGRPIEYLFYCAQDIGDYGVEWFPTTHRRMRMHFWLKKLLILAAKRWPEAILKIVAERARIDQVDSNLAMISNIIKVLAKGPLKHVVAITGGRYYGCHFGPDLWADYEIPFVEDVHKGPEPNWYFAVENHIKEQAQQQGFTWSVFRPHNLIGHVSNMPFNFATGFAVYASLMKKMQQPLVFPNRQDSFEAVAPLTSVKTVVDASVWSCDHDQAKNEAFNLASRPFSWQEVWPQIADYFGMPVQGAGKGYSILKLMEEKDKYWSELVEEYQLEEKDVDKLMDAAYVGCLFFATYDSKYCDKKLKSAGFINKDEPFPVFRDFFDGLKQKNIIPK